MRTRCWICGASSQPHVSKSFDAYGLSTVHYVRCDACGFVWSGTHAELSHEVWSELNHAYHSAYQVTSINGDDPVWTERLLLQARAIVQLERIGLLAHTGPWLDYACGDGKLVRVLNDLEHAMVGYDKYMPSAAKSNVAEADLYPGKFSLVVNTSYMEHVRSIDQVKSMIDLVAEDGVFAFHTHVSRSIPRSPGWHYYLPVHTAFYTDESLRRLFLDYGFEACVLHFDARLWFMFRSASGREEAFRRVDNFALGPSYHVDRKFVPASSTRQVLRTAAWIARRGAAAVAGPRGF